MSAEEMSVMLVAGGRASGLLNVQAAVHLLTFTELVGCRDFQDAVEVSSVRLLEPDGTRSATPATAAFVVDWRGLCDLSSAARMGGGANRLLELAVSWAVGRPVDLRDCASNVLGSAHSRRLIEAVRIAMGGPLHEELQRL